MTTPSPFGFLEGLTKPDENLIPVPSVGGPRGFIGQGIVQHRFRFWSDVDLAASFWTDKAALPSDNKEYIPRYDHRMGRENSWWYYFTDQEAANKAAKAATTKGFGANHVVLTTMLMDKMLTEIDPSKWSNGISDATDVVGPRAKFARWVPFLGIWVPALVEAIAYVGGYTSERRVLSVLSSINSLERQDAARRKETEDKGEVYTSLFDDTFQERMVGHDESSYWASELGRARAELWAELGEPDPKNYRLPTPGATPGQFETTAEKLQTCLKPASGNWQRPLWVRCAFIPNPIVDAISVSKSDGKVRRLQSLCITDIFISEESAREALPKETEHTATGGPAVPQQWQQIPELWVDQVKTYKSLYATPDAISPADLTRCNATVADFTAWWDIV